MTAATEENAAPAARRGRGILGTSGWVALLVLVVTAFGFVASRSEPAAYTGPRDDDVVAAQRAVDALLTPGPRPEALSLLPSDFTSVTGVEPGQSAAMDGTVRAVHVDGGCSTPWGDDDTRWDFGTPCRAHDLGYDLLRYAEKKGQPLPPETRRALDDRLSADMHATCAINPRDSEGMCETVADLYSAGIVVNSWHQRWGPPVGEPIVPILAGVAVIGFLLSFRLRGWLLLRRSRPRPAPAPKAAPVPGRRWTLLGVASISLLVLGESAVALAKWAGASESWLWPFTWLAQLAFVFFFAGGHANSAGWLAVVRSGGGYREYLVHRASWLLRLTMVFAVVAFAVPTALELLKIPSGTTETVIRIALHPLWLLGVYVLATAATPALLAVHRKAPVSGLFGLFGLLVVAEIGAIRTGSHVLGAVAGLGLALLAQQLAFANADRVRMRRWALAAVAAMGTAGLVTGVALGAFPLTMLGAPDASPTLAGPTLPVLLLGIVQLSLLGLVREPLSALARTPFMLRVAAFASRAPMTLYLIFLAAMLLLVALVYLPARLGDGAAWLLRPQPLLALALLAVPAAAVFWWFERHLGHHPPSPPTGPGHSGRFDKTLAYAATAAGIGFATIGVFGFALTTFGGSQDSILTGVALDPIQSLVHLLLGMSLLHTVRTGASNAPSTWLLTAVASVPPLLSATSGSSVDAIGLSVHGVTAVLAIGLVLATAWTTRMTTRYAT
ncbi:phospholipase [Prauserella marina]|nr:phospholipase A2 [Prauserella marina]ASR39641.1 phospholipase [Prauserella marina]